MKRACPLSEPQSADYNSFDVGDPDYPVGPEDLPNRHLFFKMACDSCGHSFPVPVYCGNRFCPTCGIRRRNRVRKRLQWLVKNVDVPRKFGFKHLTLTISNQKNLAGMSKEIIKSFRKLRNRQFWKNNVDGGAFVIEIKGCPNNWHVHIHAIIVARYMLFSTLLQLWMKVSPGRGVYIQRIPPTVVTTYLTKYLTKSDASTDVLEDMNWELHDKRLFNPFGSWHALLKKYEQPKHLCEKCNNSSYIPWDLMYGNFPQPFYADAAQINSKSFYDG